MSWRGETNCAIYVAQVKDRTVTSASATMSFGMEVNLSMQFPKSEQCVCVCVLQAVSTNNRQCIFSF